MRKTDKTPTFETSLAALERIVRELERGEVALEESLRLFEEGVKLSRECQERLTQAERRISVLLQDSTGRPMLADVDETDDNFTLSDALPHPDWADVAPDDDDDLTF